MNQYRQYGPRDDQDAHEGDAKFLAVNLRLSPDKLPPGILADSENNRMSEGDVAPRLGVLKPGWLNVTAAAVDAGIRPVGTFYGGGTFKDPNSFEWVLEAADGGIYRCVPNNARFGMALPMGVKILGECTFVQAFNKVFCFRGRYLAPLVLTDIDAVWADILPHWAAASTYDAAVTAIERLADEIAYGPFGIVTSITSAGDMATVTTSLAHGYITGADITIAGAVQSEYNGRFNITVVDEVTFTYQFIGSVTSPANYLFTLAPGALTRASTTATVVKVAHGLTTGDPVQIAGADQTTYNGIYEITVVDPDTFTYQMVATGATPATGTIVVTVGGLVASNMSAYWKARGSQVTLSALSWSAGTATATATAHGFTGGQYATIAGAAQAGYNGTYLITVLDANTFTYEIPDPLTTPATGTITAQTSIVLVGQSPDTNPEAWARVHNILPNATTALYINNRLLIPTAYTPGASGADGYNSAANTYTKVDFIVATSIQDEVHFDFVDEFRINQGDAGEIVDLAKYDNDTVLVWKDNVWGILTGIRLALDNVALDMRPSNYGLAARGAFCVAGKDVYFMATNRGVVSLNQTEQGLVQSVDTPFSNDIEPWIGRINWNLKAKIRMAWWDNKLYVGVPMDDCKVRTIVASGGTFFPFVILTDLTPGQTYYWDKGNATSLTYFRDGEGTTLTASGVFTMVETVIYLEGPYEATWSGTLTQQTAQCANAILVHDFRNLARVRAVLGSDAQAWAGRDTGGAICPQEFLHATIGGKARLVFLGADGYANLVEECRAGDQVASPTPGSWLGWVAIRTRVQTRGYTHAEIMPKRFPFLDIALSVWNASYSLVASTGNGRSTQTLATAKSFSRTKYLRPFDRAPWDATNVNDDFAEPNRGNYSVPVTDTGILCGSALSLNARYDLFVRYSTRTLTGGYVQFLLTNNTGRCTLRAIAPAASEGPRRQGTIV